MSSRQDFAVRALAVGLCVATIVLALLAYGFHRQAEEKARQAAAAVASERQVMQAFQTADAHSRLLYHMIGNKPLPETEVLALTRDFPLTGPMAQADTDFQKDLAQYGVNAKPNHRNYRGLLQYAHDMMRSRNAEVTRAAERELELIEERETLRQELQTRIAMLERAAEDAIADLRAQRDQFNEDRNRLQTQNSELANQVAIRQQALADLMKQHETEVSDLHAKARLLQLRLDMMAENLARTRGLKVPDQPDGELTWVGGRSQSAQINLGSADGLKRQVTFLVYDKSVSHLDGAQAKGKVEVTSVKDAHRAEVRILEEQLDEPLMPGDKVYSPAWRKGAQVRFAMVGLMDLDGDGHSDAEKAKGLISANGGAVDAELSADGTISGAMSLETDFLVRGDPPSGTDGTPALENYTKMIDQADRLGVPSIPLDRFLSMLGYSE